MSDKILDRAGLGMAAIFVGRPIFALVLNLLVIIAGLVALAGVEVRELPNVDKPVISVRTSYPGASPSTIDAEVTSVLEDALAQLGGLQKISASSTYGQSRITLKLSESVDIANAANDARELVAGVARSLPETLDEPVVSKNDADADPVIRVALTGTVSLGELTTLAEGVVSDRLATVDGVADVEIGGEQQRIMRVTFLPIQLASRGLSAANLRDALASANLDQPLGALDTSTQALIVRSVSSATTVEAISNIRLNRNTVVGDVAFVPFASDDPTAISRVNGQPSVSLNIIRQSLGNTLNISKGIEPCIPSRKNRKKQYDNDKTLYKKRLKRKDWSIMHAKSGNREHDVMNDQDRPPV